MTIRPHLKMHADFPDDCVEDDEDIILFPGRNIAEALRDALGARGYRVSEPMHAGEHGWELEAYQDRLRRWIQITQLGDECIVMTRNMASWLRPDLPAFRRFLSDLQAVLEADPRFSRIGWLTKDFSYTDAPPAAGPFDD